MVFELLHPLGINCADTLSYNRANWQRLLHKATNNFILR